MKLMLEEQMKEKINLEMALSSANSETNDPSANDTELELSKKQSYMSETGQFNGEIMTPQKMAEHDAIQLEEL